VIVDPHRTPTIHLHIDMSLGHSRSSIDEKHVFYVFFKFFSMFFCVF